MEGAIFIDDLATDEVVHGEVLDVELSVVLLVDRFNKSFDVALIEFLRADFLSRDVHSDLGEIGRVVQSVA